MWRDSFFFFPRGNWNWWWGEDIIKESLNKYVQFYSSVAVVLLTSAWLKADLVTPDSHLITFEEQKLGYWGY